MKRDNKQLFLEGFKRHLENIIFKTSLLVKSVCVRKVTLTVALFSDLTIQEKASAEDTGIRGDARTSSFGCRVRKKIYENWKNKQVTFNNFFILSKIKALRKLPRKYSFVVGVEVEAGEHRKDTLRIVRNDSEVEQTGLKVWK